MAEDDDTIADRLENVREKLAAAAERSGRKAEDITLMAVTKTWPAEIVMEAVDAGQTVFGENKVQEGLAKIPLLPNRLEWHLIGHLQKNKIRKALSVFPVIHSVDSLELAEQIDRIAGEDGLFPEIYLQVNVDEDEAKFGFSRDGIRGDLEALLELERLQIAGLMTIPSIAEDPEETREAFVRLRELRDELEKAAGIPLPGLSMGMSGDYEIAIEEGATIVRVGSEIFGKRRNMVRKG